MIDWLTRQARERGNHTALIGGDSTVTWAELARTAARCAQRLAACGVAPGDRVGWEGRADPAAIGWLHGILWRGATVLPLPPALPPATLADLVAHVQPRLLLAARPDAPSWRAAATRALAFSEQPTADSPQAPPAPPERDRIVTLMRTSGSGGEPKLVPLRCRHHEASAIAVGRRLALTASDRWLLCLPPEHIGGLAILFRSMHTGAAVVLHERFEAARVAAAIGDGSVTHASVVPTMLRRIVDAIATPPGPELRCVLVGGAPSDGALLERARAVGVPAVPTWGMSEAASQLATLTPGEAGRIGPDAGPGLVGRPLAGVEVRAGTANDAEELQVRGPMVFDGYFGAPDAQVVDADGWFATGDRGYVDRDGWLYVTGRVGDRIISGGENVEPGAVEALIRASGLVRDAGVVGIPDEEWGQRVVAVVETERSIAELEAWARARLEPAQRPRRWIPVDALPRGRTGKPRRSELLRLAASK